MCKTEQITVFCKEKKLIKWYVKFLYSISGFIQNFVIYECLDVDFPFKIIGEHK